MRRTGIPLDDEGTDEDEKVPLALGRGALPGGPVLGRVVGGRILQRGLRRGESDRIRFQGDGTDRQSR
ncbi:protein of unknown function [Methylococcus capsulatus]|uniref:Uncharacterized protein n=1 Tax=Methylococcus capsulatus TaxID=414 RepID=A0AA35UFN8_METCP|nr:protein of unknown function [Methylococcus capsulatus]